MPVIVGGGGGYKGKLRFGGVPPVFECGLVWERVVGLNSKATSFADSIDKMFGVSSPESLISLDSCMHASTLDACIIFISSSKQFSYRKIPNTNFLVGLTPD